MDMSNREIIHKNVGNDIYSEDGQSPSKLSSLCDEQREQSLANHTAGKGSRPQKWNREIDFIETRQRLLQLVKYNFSFEGSQKVRHFGYLIMLYVQLCNGSRAVEAYDGFNQWLKNGNREQTVRVRKTKARVMFRKILIPPEILDEYKMKILEYDVKFFLNSYKMFPHFTDGLKFNTYSCRYSFISY